MEVSGAFGTFLSFSSFYKVISDMFGVLLPRKAFCISAAVLNGFAMIAFLDFAKQIRVKSVSRV